MISPSVEKHEKKKEGPGVRWVPHVLSLNLHNYTK